MTRAGCVRWAISYLQDAQRTVDKVEVKGMSHKALKEADEAAASLYHDLREISAIADALKDEAVDAFKQVHLALKAMEVASSRGKLKKEEEV